MTRATLLESFSKQVIAAGVVGAALGTVFGLKVLTGGDRIAALEARVSTVERMATVVDALALSDCVKTDSARAQFAQVRAALRCWERQR
jgi:hypothetical protein